jgi:hypothetical protein
MLSTTLNIHRDTLTVLSRAAIKLGISRRDVIVSLLMRIMDNINIFRREFATIKYQPDASRGEWRCFSIKFRPEETEFFADLRNFCKCSVSFLVAIAVEKYLDDMLDDYDRHRHNYPRFCNYAMCKEIMNGSIFWIIYWVTHKGIMHYKRE